MAKFDIYRNPDGPGYLLDCQADLLTGLGTRLVVPLLPSDDAPRPADRLNPIFRIDGADHVMVTQFAATIPTALMGDFTLSLRDRDIAIGNALNMLISGF